MIEHFAGAFPTWLAPVQVLFIPVADKFLDYAKEVERELKAAGVRVRMETGEKVWANAYAQGN